jgi:hypothetical protein
MAFLPILILSFLALSQLLPGAAQFAATALSQVLPGGAPSNPAPVVWHLAGTPGSPLAWEDISLGFPSPVLIAGLASSSRLATSLRSHQHHSQDFPSPSMRYDVFLGLWSICEFNLLMMVILGCFAFCFENLKQIRDKIIFTSSKLN